MFIVFEGIDNIGKTTQVKMLSSVLQANSIEVVLYKDLTIYTKEAFSRLDNIGKIDFITTQRSMYVKDLKAKSDSGAIIIMDRFIDSTLVYQGINEAARDLIMKEHLRKINVKPDLTFTLAYLDKNHFDYDRGTSDFLDVKYKSRAIEFNQKFMDESYSESRLIVDGSLTINDMHDTISVHTHCNSTFTKLYALKDRKNRALCVKK